MANDPKLRGASRAAKNIMDGAGDLSGMGEKYTDRQIFETTNELMPADIQYSPRPVGLEDARAAQHQNFTASPYGDDGHSRSMDDVDRTDFPNAPILEAQYMGQGENFMPPSAANTSTMMGKSPRRPSRTRHGDASSVATKFRCKGPLNA